MVKTSGWSLPEPRAEGPPFLTKSQIASALEQVAVLLELDGANRFRVIAYQNASRALASLEEDLLTVVKEERITDVKGIGKGLGGLITEAVLQGTWGDLPSLYEKIPPGLMEIVEIPGLGPKRARTMYEELGVDSVEALKVACETGHVAPLSGFGEKSQQKYLEGIELLRRYQGRSRMDVGLLYGRSLEDKISSMSGVVLAQLAGSARRRRETIGDLDIVVGANPQDHDSVIQSILELPGIAEVKGHGESKVSLILESNVLGGSMGESSMDANLAEAFLERSSDATIDAQVRIVTPEAFPFTLAYFTGSKEHNIRMRQAAIDRGLRLNEFGLFSEEDAGDAIGMEAAKHTLKCSTEEDIYSNLGMKWVPPELREDTGEIEAAVDGGVGLPRLIEPSDIRGALHNHTIASDGTATLEEMSAAAIELGWEYLGIADHSEVLNIGGRQIGVPAADLAAQADSIRTLNEQWRDSNQDFRLLHGSECDILVDGSLDYDDDTRNSLSHVIGSVHALGSWRNRDELTNTEALIRAIEDPTFTVLGHPTGRILQGREGFPVDMHAVLRRMGDLNSEGQLKAVEINASPYRLDLDWRLCKYARDQGVPVCINPDAHDTNGLRDYWYGVQIARKGWLSSADVLNTRSGAEIEALLGI
ncbi:MAG TPA: DNA polymerase/3'-5' exonuclease PolX [Candidatus Poseidoniales archaeon]|nr:MAG TPA: DNA polymerase/3'-5' exonuclease PolX [Candidatus Poseidoniales archaeon]HIH56219.1 DNA polymerase/3'-5' exonuclease PolX [Candidatus Thalassarchaeum sp.]|tara:strand:- start:706 stop:2646 length:1941 start_codon:yes stop_codon:yes gene_type:complete